MGSIGQPRIAPRADRTYMGIRFVTPFKGMANAIGKVARELSDWVERHELKTAGPPFLRYHVIDMRGFMDIAYCIPVPKARIGDESRAALGQYHAAPVADHQRFAHRRPQAPERRADGRLRQIQSRGGSGDGPGVGDGNEHG